MYLKDKINKATNKRCLFLRNNYFRDHFWPTFTRSPKYARPFLFTCDVSCKQPFVGLFVCCYSLLLIHIPRCGMCRLVLILKVYLCTHCVHLLYTRKRTQAYRLFCNLILKFNSAQILVLQELFRSMVGQFAVETETPCFLFVASCSWWNNIRVTLIRYFMRYRERDIKKIKSFIISVGKFTILRKPFL